jgi:hypothetical protein
MCTRPRCTPAFMSPARISRTKSCKWASKVNYQDFAIIKVGSVPPWIKLVDTRNLTHDDGSGRFENVYRLAAEGDS